MEQSPFWETNRFSASKEIPRILWNPKVHYRIHKCPPPVHILSSWQTWRIKLKVLKIRPPPFWDVAPRGLVVRYRRFGSIRRQHLRGSRSPRSTNASRATYHTSGEGEGGVSTAPLGKRETDWGFSPWLRFFRAFCSVVRQMPGYNSQRRGTARTLPSKFLCCSMYCLCCVILCIVWV
jgi:hypothetical protein